MQSLATTMQFVTLRHASNDTLGAFSGARARMTVAASLGGFGLRNRVSRPRFLPTGSVGTIERGSLAYLCGSLFDVR